MNDIVIDKIKFVRVVYWSVVREICKRKVFLVLHKNESNRSVVQNYMIIALMTFIFLILFLISCGLVSFSLKRCGNVFEGDKRALRLRMHSLWQMQSLSVVTWKTLRATNKNNFYKWSIVGNTHRIQRSHSYKKFILLTPAEDELTILFIRKTRKKRRNVRFQFIMPSKSISFCHTPGTY